jgi:2-dehydro-3-deoxyphosphogluconate aldolase / (4S)-4-hydroxy-2-oxoglutarate aldolase
VAIAQGPVSRRVLGVATTRDEDATIYLAEARYDARAVDVVAELGRLGVVPVVEIDDAAAAVPLGQALLAGGLPCAEITFRTVAAPDAIAALRRGCPALLVAAGTILSVEDADAALGAGAAFLVTPGLDAAVIGHATDRGVPILPGVCTPTEIQAARAHGLRVVKLFPAEPVGGVDFVRAVSAPYRDVRFVPTGGISPANLAGYLALPQVIACGGSWMVRPELIAAGDFDEVTRLTRAAIGIARSVRPLAPTAG